MKLLKQLSSVISVWTAKLENEKQAPSVSRTVNSVGWCVQRYKSGKGWQRFGKIYPKKYQAINALIDWQNMFVGEEFRVYEEVV